MAKPITASEQKMIRFRWIYLIGTFGFLTQATDGFLDPFGPQNFLGMQMTGWIFGLIYLILAFLMLISFVKYHKLNKEQIKEQVKSQMRNIENESKSE